MPRQVPTIDGVQTTVDVSPVQHIDQLVDVPVAIQRPVPSSRTLVADLGRDSCCVQGPQERVQQRTDVPVVMQRQVPTIQNVQKTVELPQVEDTKRTLGVPDVWRRQAPITPTAQKTAEVPFLRYSFLIELMTCMSRCSDRRLKCRRCRASTRSWICWS